MSQSSLLNKILVSGESKRERNFIWDAFQLIVALLLATLAFLMTNIWAESLVEKAEVVHVAVASGDLTAPKVLSVSDIKTWGFRRDSLPSTAIPNIEDLVGVTLIHPVSSGEIITSTDVAGIIDPELAGFVVPKNAKGFILPSVWLNAPFPRVKKGDTVTIAYSTQGQEKNASGVAAQNVPVVNAEIGDNGQVSNIMLTLDDKLALNLVQLRANNYQLAVVVDGVAPESNIFKKN